MLGTATWTSVSSNCSRSPGCTRYSVPPSLVGICTPGRGGAGLRDSHLQWQRRGGVEVQPGAEWHICAVQSYRATCQDVSRPEPSSRALQDGARGGALSEHAATPLSP